MPPNQLTSTSDIEHRLRDKMGTIEAIVEAMAAGESDIDLKIADAVEGEPETVKMAIVEKLREILRERAAEKEQELDKHLAADKKLQVQRQRNVFMQWLQWIMSEETLRKIRMAFLSSPGLSQQVRNIGHDLSSFGVQQQLEQQQRDKRDLGGLSANVSASQGAERGKDEGKGRG